MPVPAVYLDECIDVRLAEALHQRGFIAVTSLTTGMLGSTDEEQLMYATAYGLMLVTHNRRHFRRLHACFMSSIARTASLSCSPARPPCPASQCVSR